ncbi:MAG: GAK system CofD-like protein [Thermodesulfobacteriota bacterium]
MYVELTRSVSIPNAAKLALYRKSPEYGPKILFFSGGSALRDVSRKLIEYTHNSIHIMTPFDSGGSSAVLREAFNMPAVGDIRNRLMALADQSLQGNPEVYRLFAYRLSETERPNVLQDTIDAMIGGDHPLTADIAHPMRKIIRHHLAVFNRHKPASFDLRGASIGNLVLTGGYLNYDRHLDPVIFIYSKLVQVRGTVRPIVNLPLHLAATLQSGETVIGQHRITGKSHAPISARITEISLTRSLKRLEPVSITVRNKISALIQEADLICFPMGSFFSSVLVNLLPHGVGHAVCHNPCPKVFIPNMGIDPECRDMTIVDQIQWIQRLLARDLPVMSGGMSLLDMVVLDVARSDFPSTADIDMLKSSGIRIIAADLASRERPDRIDAERLIAVLLSIC